jgi:hypothetical protein
MAKFLRLVNGVARSFEEAGAIPIYDESFEVVSDITTGTPVTLPNSGTYDSDELEVYLNGQRLEQLVDYNYEGSAPRTQVSFTFDLVEGDLVRFRRDRGA